MTSIAVIEDNIELAKGLESNLLLEGYQVTLCHDGADALSHIVSNRPDLLILDMMLPHVDGFSIINQLQKKQIIIPTLCLTARSTEMDKVRALRSGADDYLTKPFGLMELLARVEALLRRNGQTATTNDAVLTTTTVGHLSINEDTQQVCTDQGSVALAPKEYQLLMYLCRNLNRAISRIELMQEVWGHQAAINSRTVDTHIAELRKKCQLDGSRNIQICTVSKLGYQMSTNRTYG